jgi:hypothetical protein
VASYFGRGNVVQAQSVMRTSIEKLSGQFHDLYVSGKTINLRATFLAFATDLLGIYGVLLRISVLLDIYQLINKTRLRWLFRAF